MARASSRSVSNSGSFALAALRLSTKPRLTFWSAFCKAVSASAWAASV
jgi:hypothetical protein